MRREGPGVAKIAAALKGLDGVEGKTGWFESAHYPEGTPVAHVATVHEFGTDRIPARPFMRPAVAEHGQEWLDLMAQGATAALEGRFSPEQVLEAVAIQAAGDVAKQITKLTGPPLSPETIKRKGFETLLVDTGQMIQSVTGKAERVK